MASFQQSGAALAFRTIEELDPSIADGYRVVFDRECPFEVKSSGDDNDFNFGATGVGDGSVSLEAIKVKVLVLGDESIRLELSSEADLFFHYIHVVDEVGFRMMQESQKLMIDFAEYADVLMKMVNSCIQDPQTHIAILVLKNGRARLDFVRNIEFKFVELLSINFVRSPDDLTQKHITYRYNALKSRLAIMQSKLSDVHALVKVKNPSLLLQLEAGGKPRTSKSKSSFSPAKAHRVSFGHGHS